MPEPIHPAVPHMQARIDAAEDTGRVNLPFRLKLEVYDYGLQRYVYVPGGTWTIVRVLPARFLAALTRLVKE